MQTILLVFTFCLLYKIRHACTIDELDKAFGESRYHKIYETNIKYSFGKAEVSIMEKELLEKKDQEYAKYRLR